MRFLKLRLFSSFLRNTCSIVQTVIIAFLKARFLSKINTISNETVRQHLTLTDSNTDAITLFVCGERSKIRW